MSFSQSKQQSQKDEVMLLELRAKKESFDTTQQLHEVEMGSRELFSPLETDVQRDTVEPATSRSLTCPPAVWPAIIVLLHYLPPSPVRSTGKGRYSYRPRHVLSIYLLLSVLESFWKSKISDVCRLSHLQSIVANHIFFLFWPRPNVSREPG